MTSYGPLRKQERVGAAPPGTYLPRAEIMSAFKRSGAYGEMTHHDTLSLYSVIKTKMPEIHGSLYCVIQGYHPVRLLSPSDYTAAAPAVAPSAAPSAALQSPLNSAAPSAAPSEDTTTAATTAAPSEGTTDEFGLPTEKPRTYNKWLRP